VTRPIEDIEAPRGASTITQQLAKNLWLSPSRNPLRKIKEAILTWQLERALPKRRILELYLNVVELGPGVYGVAAASLPSPYRNCDSPPIIRCGDRR
jgi:monofunctional biosynthetic peptidoglycan transglycosylase